MNQTNQQRQKKPLRIVIIGILGLLGLCLIISVISLLTNQFLPEASSTPNKLTPADLAREEESLHLMDQLGDQVWPGLDASIPQILWNEDYAFLLNSQEQMTGWDKITGITVNQHPVFKQENNADYQAFTETLPNGRYAGSMATMNATNIGFITLFKENLPPVINQIFPYRILLLSSDQYITALVHESFHAFQAENYPERFADAEKAYPSTAAYEEIFPEMSEAWQTEVQTLLDAVQEKDRANQVKLVKDFLAARESRRKNIDLSTNLELYEKRYEWLEGSAKYVELEIWKEAADSPNYHPLKTMSPDEDFHNYKDYQKRWKNEITNMKNAAKNIGDSLFYYSGMLQARLLDDLMADWKTSVGESGVWYEDLLAEAVHQ